MKRRYLAALLAPLLVISTQISTEISAVAATPTYSIANIAPNKLAIRPAGVLKVTWNFSSENLTLDEAKKMEVTLTPVSGIACQPRCPYGMAKIISGDVSGGLWQAYIDIPGTAMTTDYEVNVALPGVSATGKATKSQSIVSIVADADATETASVVPTITGTGWAPSIGPITRFKGGFKFKILNFNTNYTWSYSSWYGTPGIDGDGLFTITGLRPGVTTDITISTRSTAGVTASATFRQGSLLDAPFPLEYKVTKQGKNSVTFTIPNPDGTFKYSYRFETLNGNYVSGSYSNRGGEYTISDLLESSTVIIDAFITSSSNEEAYGRIITSTLPLPAPVVIATPTPTPTATPTPTPTPAPTPTMSATPTPMQSATPSPTPKVKKTITCVKGKITQKITNFNPKCPAGYKKR
jgi:hypothetical protein